MFRGLGLTMKSDAGGDAFAETVREKRWERGEDAYRLVACTFMPDTSEGCLGR
jgi:hypothetical protein